MYCRQIVSRDEIEQVARLRQQCFIKRGHSFQKNHADDLDRETLLVGLFDENDEIVCSINAAVHLGKDRNLFFDRIARGPLRPSAHPEVMKYDTVLELFRLGKYKKCIHLRQHMQKIFEFIEVHAGITLFAMDTIVLVAPVSRGVARIYEDWCQLHQGESKSLGINAQFGDSLYNIMGYHYAPAATTMAEVIPFASPLNQSSQAGETLRLKTAA